ncbi:MAG: Dipeptidase [Firmicutes bacterium ADurb.Bin153]|nr:MAG: Dipeptidase [Firmicutes bacterium ADurb.Bin153]
MLFKKRVLLLSVVIALVLALSTASYACTIVAVGNKASVDGSTMVTHNDDSTVADFRLWIIKGGEHKEGETRPLVIDGHDYIDYSNWPNVDYTKSMNGQAMVAGEIPQVAKTYTYLHSRYSFINEVGVSMGESTFSYDRTNDREKAIYKAMVSDSPGIIDCWLAQDIALERAKTAREAVLIMGALVEKYGWLGPGETMDIADGNEVWIAEFYGRDIWAAVRIPADHFFVAANRARIGEIDLKDTANYLASPNIVSYATEKGWYDPKSGKPFLCYENYAPYNGVYSTRREWRAFDLVAPSLKLVSTDKRFPFSVKPEKKMSLQDVWNIKADYYQGTEYDTSKGAAAGPWGNPLRYPNSDPRGGGWERTINMHRTCYLMIGQTKAWLPDPIKGVVWYGYGAPDTTYLTPLWAAMGSLPAFYQTGSRYQPFRRDSGWWANTYVQELATLKYQSAVKDIRDFRQPRMDMLYTMVPLIQDKAAELYKTDPKAAISLISEFAYANAVAWHEDWLLLGDKLLGKYVFGSTYLKTTAFPQWWNDLIGFTSMPGK